MSNSYQDSNASRLSLRREAKRKFPRGHISIAAVAAFAACTIALPALAQSALPALAQPLPAPTTVTGTVAATLTISFKTAPPKGSTVSCNVALIGSDTLAPSDSQFVNATVSGSTATCPLTLHYKWRLSSVATNMTIAYSVSGPVQVSSGIYEIITVPASGVTTTVTVAIQQ